MSELIAQIKAGDILSPEVLKQALIDQDAEITWLRKKNAQLLEALDPFASALKFARQNLNGIPERADVTTLSHRWISYDHLKDALSEVVLAHATRQESE